MTISITERRRCVKCDTLRTILAQKLGPSFLGQVSGNCSMHHVCYGGDTEQPSFPFSRRQHEIRSSLNLQLIEALHGGSICLLSAGSRDVVCNLQHVPHYVS